MSLMLGGRRIEAAVFDFDGVLADTAHGWARAEAALCDSFGVTYTADLAEQTHGVGLDDAVRVLTAAVDPPVLHHEACALMRELAYKHVPADASAIEGAVESVRILASRVPVAIASNSERPLLELLVVDLALDDTVAAVVSASDVTAPKPAPDVYLEAVRRLGGTPGRTLAVEDSSTGGTAAHAAGCVVVALDLPVKGTNRLDPPWATVTVTSHAQLCAMIEPAPGKERCDRR
ncbi:HAD family hydrolase [Ornithinimicrobium sediminis]|uniref:HAD family hydrolase n=1 Tax=Ornithinimicrobium sediminis TaxID=2904603 RepID=UPI001E58A148|nr:HAD family phosphatase [Ornithinimicrobium sediminis]MCE0487389.1 HAD family phosphatase [Ornithinimicrobium sediminis]